MTTSAAGEKGAVNAPLQVYGRLETLELAPVLLAIRDHYPAGAEMHLGAINNLVGEPSIGGTPPSGKADVATNAETQALRYSVKNPDLRIILTITEGYYRIVARRSAGITTLADLKGKRIASLEPTSGGYFLAKMLSQAGLTIKDVEVVNIFPIDGMPGALARGEVDAVSIWDPAATESAKVLNGDITEFDGKGIYRELFNLNTTEANLTDPVMRTRIVDFVRAISDAAKEIKRNPAEAQGLVVETAKLAPSTVADSWGHLGFTAALPDDLLNVLVEEEKWLASQEGREPRAREDLAKLIDSSVYEEAMRIER
ncbi:MAG: ABC transporter substrate-binding protein [Sphingobium sp.]